MMILMIASIWACLTLVFILRLRVIMADLTLLVSPGTSWLKVPVFDVRPLKHALAWAAELAALAFMYGVFGTSLIAHLCATFVAVGMMILLRDRTERGLLRQIQILPMSLAVA